MLRNQHRIAIYKDIVLGHNVITRGDLWLGWIHKYVYRMGPLGVFVDWVRSPRRGGRPVCPTLHGKGGERMATSNRRQKKAVTLGREEALIPEVLLAREAAWARRFILAEKVRLVG